MLFHVALVPSPFFVLPYQFSRSPPHPPFSLRQGVLPAVGRGDGPARPCQRGCEFLPVLPHVAPVPRRVQAAHGPPQGGGPGRGRTQLRWGGEEGVGVLADNMSNVYIVTFIGKIFK